MARRLRYTRWLRRFPAGTEFRWAWDRLFGGVQYDRHDPVPGTVGLRDLWHLWNARYIEAVPGTVEYREPGDEPSQDQPPALFSMEHAGGGYYDVRGPDRAERVRGRERAEQLLAEWRGAPV